jgi:hypothetical protein
MRHYYNITYYASKFFHIKRISNKNKFKEKMATNRDLLKEAIADAKAVKETAIANAKAALEEAFTPYLKEKLSAKLAEMEDDTDESMYETEEKMDEMKMEDEAMEMEEISLDELLAELEEESDMEENYMEEEELYEAKEEEEEMSIEDMSEDDLKSFIEDVIKDMVSAGELEAGHEGMENEEGEEEGEEMEAGEEEEIDEEINIDELLAELEETSYSKKATPKGSLASTKGKDEHVTDTTEEDDAPYSKGEATKVSFDENLDEYLSDVVLSGPEIIASLLGVAATVVTAALGTPEIRKGIMDAIKAKNFSKAKELVLKGSSKSEETKSEMEEQLDELRSELNEVNLLNAKLLYTNKIFRNKSLNETQKVKVLTAFDKATSKKEVELVYETLLESLKTTTKAPIKESMSSASRVLGGTTSKPIIENDAFARMRELAFGRNK